MDVVGPWLFYIVYISLDTIKKISWVYTILQSLDLFKWDILVNNRYITHGKSDLIV